MLSNSCLWRYNEQGHISNMVKKAWIKEMSIDQQQSHRINNEPAALRRVFNVVKNLREDKRQSFARYQALYRAYKIKSVKLTDVPTAGSTSARTVTCDMTSTCFSAELAVVQGTVWESAAF